MWNLKKKELYRGDKMGLEDFLDNDDMQINKDIDTVSDVDNVQAEQVVKDYVGMLGKKKKAKKNTVSVYLDDETLDKMKTICAKQKISMSSAIETWIVELTKDVIIDPKLVKKYDKNKKGRK